MALTTVQNYSLRPVYTSFVPPKGDKGDPIPVMFPAGFRNDEGGVTAGILRVDDDILAHLRKTIPAVKEAFDEQTFVQGETLLPPRHAIGADLLFARFHKRPKRRGAQGQEIHLVTRSEADKIMAGSL